MDPAHNFQTHPSLYPIIFAVGLLFSNEGVGEKFGIESNEKGSRPNAPRSILAGQLRVIPRGMCVSSVLPCTPFGG